MSPPAQVASKQNAKASLPHVTRIEHVVRPLSGMRGPGRLHRFRIPLSGAQLSYVDLDYKKPLINELGAHDLIINGGYWAEHARSRKIQGLLVVDGKLIAPRASNLSGGILEIREGRALLHRSDTTSDFEGASLAIQCSPRLVSAGKVIAKLETQKLAARTALCIRDEGRTLDAYLTAEDTRITLQELATFLVAEGCNAALNLDGGPSTAAAYRAAEGVLTVGLGEELPYGLGVVSRQ